MESIDGFSLVVATLAFSLLATANGLAASLQSIDYSSPSVDKIQITATFSESIEAPNSFSIDKPARVVLDFPDVQNELGKSTQAINMGIARSVSTVEADDRTRVIINLLQSAPYTIEHEDNIVKVMIDQQETLIGGSGITREVTNIEFDRGENGEGRLTIFC